MAILTTSGSLMAQDQAIKIDGGIGGAFSFGDLNAGGISVSLEPKFFFNSRIAAGIRLEGDVLFGGSVDGATSVDVGTSSRTAMVVKGEYYFSDNATRLFAGLMAGRYTQANAGGSSTGATSIEATDGFGFAPEFGVTFNNFRVSGIYHIIPGGGELASVQVGDANSISRNYVVLTLGFKIARFGL